MAKYKTLNEAMTAKDDLGEVELRYALLAEVFEAVPNLRANLNPALERAKAEILRLRAAGPPKSEGTGQVVKFDMTRFRKSGVAGGVDPGPEVATTRSRAASRGAGIDYGTSG